MQTAKARSLLQRDFTVIYRWIRRRRYFPHALAIVAAVLFLPAGFVSGAKLSQILSGNNALAATRAGVPAPEIFGDMSAREKRAYAATLASLVADQPEKINELVAGEVLVLFREPDLKRTEGAATVWQYRDGACVLDIYLKNTGGEEHSADVIHHELRARATARLGKAPAGDDDVKAADCLRALGERKDA